MKLLLLVIGLGYFFLSQKVCPQQITPQDLIGVWDKTDSTKEKLSFKFIDGSNLIVEDLAASNKLSYKLVTDSVTKATIILLEMDKEGIKQQSSYFIEVVNKSVLKLVNRDNNMRSVELPFETNKGTFYLAKSK